MTVSGTECSFPIAVPQARIDRTRRQLELADIGYAADDDGNWVYATDARYLRTLRDYRLHSYDWRAAERRLNAFPLYETTVDALAVHYCRVRGDGSRLPVILSHGWPGSIVEFLDVIAPLCDAGNDVIVPACRGSASRSVLPARSARPTSPACGTS